MGPVTRASVLGAALLILGACEPQVGVPAEAEAARGVVPKAARADFDLVTQVRVATRACVTSELSGPATLSSLLSQGYSPVREYGNILYARIEGPEGKPRGTRVDTVRVLDQNDTTACTVEVFRNSGYTALAAAESEVARMGYQPVTSGRFTRYIGKGQRFDIIGTTSTYSPHALITIRRITDPRTDRLCSDARQPAAIREGC